MAHEVIIEGKAYPIKFGYGAFRTLAEKWGSKGVMALFQEIMKLFSDMETLTFKEEALIAELVICGIKNIAPEGMEMPSNDDVLTMFIFNADERQKVMDALMGAMPQQSGNPQPAQKAGKPKLKKK